MVSVSLFICFRKILKLIYSKGNAKIAFFKKPMMDCD
jgi:hypothetical protein